MVLYLVNAADQPEAAPYVAMEMEVLAWIGKPVLLLLNQTGLAGDPRRAGSSLRCWPRRRCETLKEGRDMTMATTTIRIDIDTLPDHLDRSRPNVVAEVIEAALREGGIRADCSDLFSHLKIDLPTAQLAAASVVLVDLQLI